VSAGGTPTGCGDKGHCGSGSCNKLNTYDWISTRDMFDPTQYNIVEVSFKKGAHKDFYINDPHSRAITGDMVVVETSSGFDIGRISLSGELVRLQMKKKFTVEDRVEFKIIRKANDRDLEKLDEARQLEKQTLVKARVISRTLGLEMKIGDIAYQGDKKKATFYYTAEGRVDFRELVKEYAREFKIKIEMRQIGARQESARIGGIGSCGRELCCSTWLSDFKSVNTSAARYQNIAINQSKLSGQCGRLKCCLNYELDTYLDALDDFPQDADYLKTKVGNAHLIKTDIFKGILYYGYEGDKMRGTIIAVDKNRAKEVKALNKKGQFPDDLNEHVAINTPLNNDDPDKIHEYEDVTGLIELKNEPRKNKNRKKPAGNKGTRPINQGAKGNAPKANPNNPQSNEGLSSNRPQRNKQNPNNPNQGGNPRQEGNDPKNQNPNQNKATQPVKRENNTPNEGGQQKNRPLRPENKGPRPPRPDREKDQTPREPGNPTNLSDGSAETKDRSDNRNQRPPRTNQEPRKQGSGEQNNSTNPNDGSAENKPRPKKKFFNKNRKPNDGGGGNSSGGTPS